MPNKWIPPLSTPNKCVLNVNPGILKSRIFPGKFILKSNTLYSQPLTKKYTYLLFQCQVYKPI